MQTVIIFLKTTPTIRIEAVMSHEEAARLAGDWQNQLISSAEGSIRFGVYAATHVNGSKMTLALRFSDVLAIA